MDIENVVYLTEIALNSVLEIWNLTKGSTVSAVTQ